MRLFLTGAQLALLFMANPAVAPHPRLKPDLDWLTRKGLLTTRPDGTFRRSAAGQRRVVAEIEAAGRPCASDPEAGGQMSPAR